MESIILLIVVYKKNIYESLTIQSLLKSDFREMIKKGKLLVWDNSPIPLPVNQVEYLENNFSIFEYIHTPKNISLSQIYNTVTLRNKNMDYLMILDHDSKLPMNYFSILKSAISTNPNINLFLPLIMQAHTARLISPANRKFIKGEYWTEKKTGLVNAIKKLSINSATTISLKYLSENYPAYNENLTFYGIDTQFMIDYETKNDFFFVLPLEVIHESALVSDTDVNSYLWRFKNRMNAWKIIYSKSLLEKVIVRFHILYEAIKMNLKFRTINFFYATK